jgi:hypothetical protein
MPYFPPYGEDELPKDSEQLNEWVMHAHTAGLKTGRQEGAREVCEKVDEFVKRKYMDKDVARGSDEAKAILELARELVHQLLHGDLGKVPELKAVPRAARPKNWRK